MQNDYLSPPECDVSVSIFSIFWIVSDSVSKKIGIEKLSDSVSKKIGIGRRFGFGFVQILGILGDVSVSKLFHFLDSFGFGIEKICCRKKYRIWYRKNLLLKKSIGFGIEKIWYQKKYRLRYRKSLVS